MTFTFLLLAALLLLLVLAWLLRPLLNKNFAQSSSHAEQSDHVLHALAQRNALREAAQRIDFEQQQGILTEVSASAQRKELLLRARTEALDQPKFDDETHAPSAPPPPAHKLAALIAITLVIGSALIYLQRGRLDALDAKMLAQQAPSAPQVSGAQIAAMVERLETRLNAAPPKKEDLAQWRMLGRSQLMLGKVDAGITAYRTALNLDPTSIEDTLNLVEALLAKTQGKPDAEVKRLLANAYAKAPTAQRVLWLNAAVAQEEGDKKTAVKFLRELLPLLPANRDEANEAQRFIKELSQ